MFKKTIIGLLIVCSLLGYNPQSTTSAELKITDLPVAMQIEHFANLYGADVSVVKAVVRCESGGDHKSKGDSGFSKGIAQFQKSTFYRMAKLKGEDLNYESQFDQIKLLSYAMANPDLAREWSTFRAIKNGGTYSFYSRQLKKSFTVKCRV